MNNLTKVRLASNVVLVAAAGGLLLAMLRETETGPEWVLALAAAAILGGVAQFLVSVLQPKAIRPAWDEQTVATHRASYQFGYWAALVAFWSVFLVQLWRDTDPSGTFVVIGVILVAAPSLWMAIATFAGRAG